MKKKRSNSFDNHLEYAIFVTRKIYLSYIHTIMKKVILTTLAFVGFAVAFIGCSNNEDEKDYPLNNTIWQTEDHNSRIIFGTAGFTLRFSGDDFSCEETTGTYIYEPPIVKFTTFDDKTDKLTTRKGKIVADTLYYDDNIYFKNNR